MTRYMVAVVAASVAAVLPSPTPGLATEQGYSEDFTTTQCKDALNTTAQWDAGARELKLFSFVPPLAWAYDTPGIAREVTVSGNHAHVADTHSGLLVIDMSDPRNPTLAGGVRSSPRSPP